VKVFVFITNLKVHRSVEQFWSDWKTRDVISVFSRGGQNFARLPRRGKIWKKQNFVCKTTKKSLFFKFRGRENHPPQNDFPVENTAWVCYVRNMFASAHTSTKFVYTINTGSSRLSIFNFYAANLRYILLGKTIAAKSLSDVLNMPSCEVSWKLTNNCDLRVHKSI